MKLCPCRISKKKAGRGSNIIVFFPPGAGSKNSTPKPGFFSPPFAGAFFAGRFSAGALWMGGDPVAL